MQVDDKYLADGEITITLKELQDKVYVQLFRTAF